MISEAMFPGAIAPSPWMSAGSMMSPWSSPMGMPGFSSMSPMGMPGFSSMSPLDQCAFSPQAEMEMAMELMQMEVAIVMELLEALMQGGYNNGGFAGGGLQSLLGQIGGGLPGQGTCDLGSIQGGSALGRQLAAMAHQHATDGTGDGGHCYRNVAQDLAKIGINCHGEGAWEAADQLAHNPKVKEIGGVSRDGLKHLPPGAIVVWDKSPGHPWGHISIAEGNGTEASDIMRNQVTSLGGGGYRVFYPVG